MKHYVRQAGGCHPTGMFSCSFFKISYKIYYFYRPRRSCGKVMFLHLSVILFTVGVSGRHPSEQTPLEKTHTPQADTPLDTHPPGTHTPGQTPRLADPSSADPLSTPPRADTSPRDGHCSGWYASYWSAFFFFHLEQYLFIFSFLHALFSILSHCCVRRFCSCTLRSYWTASSSTMNDRFHSTVTTLQLSL